jgi:hypothetical protein
VNCKYTSPLEPPLGDEVPDVIVGIFLDAAMVTCPDAFVVTRISRPAIRFKSSGDHEDPFQVITLPVDGESDEIAFPLIETTEAACEPVPGPAITSPESCVIALNATADDIVTSPLEPVEIDMFSPALI